MELVREMLRTLWTLTLLNKCESRMCRKHELNRLCGLLDGIWDPCTVLSSRNTQSDTVVVITHNFSKEILEHCPAGCGAALVTFAIQLAQPGTRNVIWE